MKIFLDLVYCSFDSKHIVLVLSFSPMNVITWCGQNRHSRFRKFHVVLFCGFIVKRETKACPFYLGSVDVLHCYYAHGEENKNFQIQLFVVRILWAEYGNTLFEYNANRFLNQFG
jgi:hypothetical protein